MCPTFVCVLCFFRDGVSTSRAPYPQGMEHTGHDGISADPTSSTSAFGAGTYLEWRSAGSGAGAVTSKKGGYWIVDGEELIHEEKDQHDMDVIQSRHIALVTH